MKYNGIRIILIYSLTRNQLIDFVKRNDRSYKLASFKWHTDEQLRELAILEDKKRHAERHKNRKTIKNKKTTVDHL